MGGPPPTPSTVDDVTEPEAPPRRADRTREAAAEEAPPVPPASAELVPAAPAAPAMVDEPPAAEQRGEQGPVYTFTRPEVPRAEDLLQPRPKIDREQISCMVPAQLRLVQRMRLFWATEGMEQRDQVAHALDQWLRARGF